MANRKAVIGSILILFLINVANAEDKYSTYRYDCKARFSTNSGVRLGSHQAF